MHARSLHVSGGVNYASTHPQLTARFCDSEMCERPCWLKIMVVVTLSTGIVKYWELLIVILFVFVLPGRQIKLETCLGV